MAGPRTVDSFAVAANTPAFDEQVAVTSVAEDEAMSAIYSAPFKRPGHGVATRWERNRAALFSARINRGPRIFDRLKLPESDRLIQVASA